MALTMYSKYTSFLKQPFVGEGLRPSPTYGHLFCRVVPLISLLYLLSIAIAAQAQTDASPIIDAQNVEQLAPVEAVDFAAMPPEAGDVLNGRMLISDDSRHIAVVNTIGQIVIMDGAGNLLDMTDAVLTNDGFPATFIDGAFDPTGHVFAALHTAGSGYYVTLHGALDITQTRLIKSQDRPTAIWLDEQAIWLEVMPNDPNNDPYMVSLALDVPLGDAELVILPFAPAQGDTAIARIGRLPPPFAVTATENGMVSRWDLSAARLTAMVQVDSVPIYGAMTPDSRYLAWRDPASTALHLLDFETGDDRVVVPLNGTYIPFILLTVKADVIIGVDVNDEPMVVAWDTGSGERHDLGLYRQCGRPPDMVRLSGDGQALVIGCDQGLEIWRVKD
jgi:hypothetical protein